jgi:hypothetical protein
MLNPLRGKQKLCVRMCAMNKCMNKHVIAVADAIAVEVVAHVAVIA